MTLPSPDTPLYNHPLPEVENWLRSQGCQQDESELNRWHIDRTDWNADLWLDIDRVTVCYITAGDSSSSVQRSFKYSLSRQDIEDAIFSGP